MVHDSTAETSDPAASASRKFLAIRGARTHNLRSVDLDIPHQSLTVITGVSGSGKSSLAFDTLFAEGERQYIESLSASARQFVYSMPRPDLDSISGLQPTLCIDQRSLTGNPRGTVATVAELHDYLRLLMARIGTPFCFQCGRMIVQQSSDEIVASLSGLPSGTRLVVMAPMVRGRKGAHHDVFAKISQSGMLRARVDGEQVELENRAPLDANKSHTIEAICDRLIVRDDIYERLAAAVQLGLRLADGAVVISSAPPSSADSRSVWEDRVFSTKYACLDCGLSLAEVEPRMFSFNSPRGACPECGGLGRAADGGSTRREMSESAAPTESDDRRCPACDGKRLRPESLAVCLNGLSIADISSLALDELRDWFRRLDLNESQRQIAEPILAELAPRIDFLCRAGVGYLTLDRPSDSLSGGERQRVRLATCLGTGLVGACYILDEPSIGLHPSDTDRLIEILRQLRDQGNTVVVVEHDEAIIRAADFLVDMGPGAGPAGGMILSRGTVAEVSQDKDSITGAYLRGEKSIPIPNARRQSARRSDLWIEIRGANLRNLKSIDVAFPMGCLIGVTGVSGGGKSSLILDTLATSVNKALRNPGQSIRGPFTSITGVEHIDKLVLVDQRAIGRNPRGAPSTFTGLWDEIRDVFTRTRDAKRRGFGSNRFSFNSGPGRCEHCQGHGERKLDMKFLADVYVRCSECGGRRFNRATLEVRYKEKSVADILAMSVTEASEFFKNFSRISQILEALSQVGLGYLSLGQPSHTLSGGEAQRIKLATELSRTATSRTLYILDEPTTGLHVDDIHRLILVLRRLVEQGNTVIVIEHHLDVIKTCDWLIDLGPVGGALGGHLIATGPPELIAASESSLTGQYLRAVLN